MRDAVVVLVLLPLATTFLFPTSGGGGGCCCQPQQQCCAPPPPPWSVSIFIFRSFLGTPFVLNVVISAAVTVDVVEEDLEGRYGSSNVAHITNKRET